MTIRRVLFALAGMSLVACASDDAEPRHAYDEDRDMRHEARSDQQHGGSGNLVATPVEPAPAPAVPSQDLTTPTTSPAPDLCEGITRPESCPLTAGGAQRAQNIDGGVMVLMREDPRMPMTELEQRVRCFESRNVERSGGAECLLGLPGVSTVVLADAGTVRVRLVTTEASQVRELRERGRALTRRTGGSAHSATPAESGSGSREPANP